MSSNGDNPTFPSNPANIASGKNKPAWIYAPGLTKREYFAIRLAERAYAQAMRSGTVSVADVAARAVKMADCLFAELEKRAELGMEGAE